MTRILITVGILATVIVIACIIDARLSTNALIHETEGYLRYVYEPKGDDV